MSHAANGLKQVLLLVTRDVWRVAVCLSAVAPQLQHGCLSS
jgi:hypothetical protein